MGILFILFLPALAGAESEPVPTLEAVKGTLETNTNVVWTCIAAFLVFFMQAGFAMVEAGFTRAKNAVNILMKNLMDFSIGTIAFFLIGFGLMFGKSNGLFGTSLFAMAGVEPGSDWNWTFLIFQTVFAATAATIVSGAMAERTKFVGYLAYSFIITLFIYPIFGSWAWGGLLDGVLKIDDPVGAVSVHGVCGAWGTLSVGLFNLESGLFYGGGLKQFFVQALGAGSAFVWAFGLGLVLFYTINKTIGLRVTSEEEMKGLDIGEHGMEAYSGFQIFSNM
jgi:Amt family ammonium transporter